MTLKSAFLGCGPRARAHARAYPQVTKGQIAAICDLNEERLQSFGFGVHRTTGEEQTILAAVGSARSEVDPRELRLLPGVREVMRVAQPFKLVNRMFHPAGSVVTWAACGSAATRSW